MARQAEVESGASMRKVEPGQVFGGDEVSEEVRGKPAPAVLCVCSFSLSVQGRSALRSKSNVLCARSASSVLTLLPGFRSPTLFLWRRTLAACAPRWWAC